MFHNKKFEYYFKKTHKYLLWIVFIVAIIFYCYFLYSNFVQPFSYRWKALYGSTKYPDGDVRGIDISHYQKHIKWNQLSTITIQNSPIDFVFIKATEGNSDLDSLFDKNFQSAKKQHITRGAYHFFTTRSSGLDQAKHFCKTVKLESGDLPPVLDIEFDKNYNNGQQDNNVKYEILNWLIYVENYYRVKPIIYASFNLKDQYLKESLFNVYPYWIAHYYVDSLQYDGNWDFWQHTDAGHLDCIDGYVDIDLFNGNKEKLNKLCIE